MLEFLYAPWRKKYVESIDGKQNKESRNCPFCTQIEAHDDKTYYILRRFKHHIVMLNLYPYNPGHVLIIPYKHVQQLSALTPDERFELIELANQLSHILKTVRKADGINIGLNLEKAAGAGIPEHIHLHVLPRFIGDTNFMPLLCHTKAISHNLVELYDQLKPHVDALQL